MAKPTNVDEYIDSFPVDGADFLRDLRKLIKHRLKEFERDGVLWM